MKKYSIIIFILMFLGFCSCVTTNPLEKTIEHIKDIGSDFTFKPFVDGFLGSKQAKNYKWIKVPIKWETGLWEVQDVLEIHHFDAQTYAKPNEEIPDCYEVYKAVRTLYPGNMYLRFSGTRFMGIRYKNNFTLDEMASARTNNEKFNRVLRSFHSALGEGQKKYSTHHYIEYKNDTVYATISEGVFKTWYKPIAVPMFAAYEKKKASREEAERSVKAAEAELERIAEEKKEAERIVEERKEAERYTCGLSGPVPQRRLPAGLKSYMTGNKRVLGAWGHWSGEIWVTWMDYDGDNKCDEAVFWTHEMGIYVPFGKEPCEDARISYKEMADFMYEIGKS